MYHPIYIAKYIPDILHSMGFPNKEILSNYLNPLLEQFQVDCEEIKITKAGAKSLVKIVVDGDEALSLDSLEEISQAVSELFDDLESRQELNFGPGYTLEVTTRGLEEPLTHLRHWRRNIGRVVRISSQAPEEYAGNRFRIAQVTEEEGGEEPQVILLSSGGKTGKSHKVGSSAKVYSLPLSAVESSVLEVEFREPPIAEQELIGLDPAQYSAYL